FGGSWVGREKLQKLAARGGQQHPAAEQGSPAAPVPRVIHAVLCSRRLKRFARRFGKPPYDPRPPMADKGADVKPRRHIKQEESARTSCTENSESPVHFSYAGACGAEADSDDDAERGRASDVHLREGRHGRKST